MRVRRTQETRMRLAGPVDVRRVTTGAGQEAAIFLAADRFTHSAFRHGRAFISS
jgi:hypothetical protein